MEKIPLDLPIANDEEYPLFQIIEAIQRSQESALRVAIDLQGKRDKSVKEKRPHGQNVSDIIEGSVVYWVGKTERHSGRYRQTGRPITMARIL